jgi:hypothetical protein
VLSWSCRRFRARFTPGSTHPHRRACRECEAFAAALERSAGARLPLPAGLRRDLRQIAAPASGTVLPFPVPRLPLSGALAARLRAIPPGPPALPRWVLDPRYAVAASALAALLLGPLVATAANRGLQAAGAVREEVSPLLERTGEGGREELGRLRTGAAAACDAARRSAEESLRRLDMEVSDMSTWLFTVPTGESNHQDPRGEAGGSARRP